jgi:hypothetical protein
METFTCWIDESPLDEIVDRLACRSEHVCVVFSTPRHYHPSDLS